MAHQYNHLLPAALRAINREFASDTAIPREYQGYISSMGASIRQMGLLPTLAIYADKESGSSEPRLRLMKVLQGVLGSDQSRLPQEIKKVVNDPSYQGGALFHAAAQDLDDDDRKRLQLHLIEAAVAVKLAMRTFETTKR